MRAAVNLLLKTTEWRIRPLANDDLGFFSVSVHIQINHSDMSRKYSIIALDEVQYSSLIIG